ncbi:hypothetical protein ACFWZ2_20615 [Streptomyces sp. NPDC059002]|uniref:hypothetical protein n=1 Tax=Streptomyces sp. NPDC059002 TaxID=3346690 RepID=UPI0036A15855
MKYTKAAAVVAGSVMALGVASPAFADDVDNAPAAAQAGAGADAKGEVLVDSSTVSKNDVKNPLKDVDVRVLTDATGKLADKLATKNDLASKTNALAGTSTRAVNGAPGSGLIGGMPIGG